MKLFSTRRLSIFSSVLFLSSVLATNAFAVNTDIRLKVDTAGILCKYDNLDSAYRAAKQQDKLLYLYISGDGWNMCDSMERNVFQDSALAGYFNQQFICAHLEVSAEYGYNQVVADFLNAYDTRLCPSYLILDTSGAVVHRSTWYMDIPQFVAFGHTAFDTEANYQAVKKQIESRSYPSSVLVKYLTYANPISLYMDNGFDCEQSFLLEKYFVNQKESEFTSVENWRIISQFVVNPNCMIFQYITENPEKFYATIGKPEVDSKVISVLESWAFAGDTSSARYKYANKMVRSMTCAQAKALVSYYDTEHRYYSNINDYSVAMDKLFTEYSYSFRRIVYNTAWQIYNYAAPVQTDVTKKTIGKAIQWMELLIAYSGNLDCMHIQSQLYYLYGNPKQALRVIDAALSKAKELNENPQFIAQLENTKTYIADNTLREHYVDLNKRN